MHTHRTLNPPPDIDVPTAARRAAAYPDAWMRLVDRMNARAGFGLTPEIDAVRNRDDVAASLASCAGMIRDAEPADYEARLIEAAAECLAAVIASAAANAAADRDEAALSPDDPEALRRRIEDRRAVHRFAGLAEESSA